MNIILKYLVFTALMSFALSAEDDEKDLGCSMVSCSEIPSPPSLIPGPPSCCEHDTNFDSVENYRRLTDNYYDAKTQEAYTDAIHAIYTFVDTYPEDMYSVALLKEVALFFPVWESDVNIPLFRKIAKIQNHSNLYDALMVLYYYGDKKDKADSVLSFSTIAGDENHHQQKCARKFLDAIKNSNR